MASKRPNVIPFAEAARMWRRYGYSHPSELVLEDLAFALGVLVVDDRLDSCEGRLVRDGERGIIRIRKGLLPVGRRRFVLAHEIGHWVLHRGNSQLSICTAGDMIASYSKSRVEAEANSFASALLMPEDLFKALRGSGEPTIDKLDQLREHFDTSLTATAIRWMDLAPDYCAVVVSSKGKIEWWRGSYDFEQAFWIQTGNPISKYAAAHGVTAENLSSGQTDVGTEAWAEVKQDLTSDTFLEESIWLQGYDKILTLLWLT